MRLPMALALAGTMLLAACEEGATLVVQVRTDLVPQRDFATARTELRAVSGSFSRDADLAASSERDWGAGVRIAEIGDLAPGSYRFTASLLDAGGARVSRPVRVELGDGELRVVTVLLTADCVSVECPAPAGDPLATACVAGRCAPEECTEDDPSACVIECSETMPCPDAMAAPCATAECTASGSCFVAPQHDRCMSGQACDPVADCVDVMTPPEPPVDGGPSGPSSVDSLSADWLLQGLEVPTTSDPLTRVNAVCWTPTGIAIAGSTNKEADFGLDLMTSTPISSGPPAAFVAHILPSGTIDWLEFVEGALAAASITLVGDLLVVTGTFLDTVAFPTGARTTAPSEQDAFAMGVSLDSGVARWAVSLGTEGAHDFGAGAAGISAGVLVAARAASDGPFHFNRAMPALLVGESRGGALLAVLDPATGDQRGVVGLGSGSVEAFRLTGDSVGGALLAVASTGRMTGLHSPVAGGGGHEIAVTRLDGDARWRWTTYLEGCSGTNSIQIARNAGAVWLGLTDTRCGALPVTLASPAGALPGTAIDTGSAAPLLTTLSLAVTDGAPNAGSVHSVGLHPDGGVVGALAVDAQETLFVGGFLGLPDGGAMLDFGGGPSLFERNMAGVVQSNGAAFLWSRGPDGAFRGVDHWAAGGAGSVLSISDLLTGIVVDDGALYFGGWLHGLTFLLGTRIGGGTGFDVGFLAHAR